VTTAPSFYDGALSLSYRLSGYTTSARTSHRQGGCEPLPKTARNAFTQDSAKSVRVLKSRKDLFAVPLPGCSQQPASPPSSRDHVPLSRSALGLLLPRPQPLSEKKQPLSEKGRPQQRAGVVTAVMLLRQRMGIASCCVLCELLGVRCADCCMTCCLLGELFVCHMSCRVPCESLCAV